MNYREKLEVAEMAGASKEEAIRYLKEHAITEEVNFPDTTYSQKVLEYLFFRRNDPQINIALGKYGTYVPLLKRLYRKGNITTKIAVLTNSQVGPEEFMHGVLKKEDVYGLIDDFPTSKHLLQALFENPYISRDLITEIVNGEKVKADDKVFIFLIRYISNNNKLISTEYDETIMDGWADYTHNQLFRELWKLFSVVPVTKDWAYVLNRIANKLVLPSSHEVNWGLIDRWRIEENKDSDNMTGHCFWLRFKLAARLIKEGHTKLEDIVADNDKAVRLAYYSVCEPEDLFSYDIYKKDSQFEYPSVEETDDYLKNEPETQRKAIEICKQLFELDKNEFIDQLIDNENFWKRKEERSLLHNLAWNLAEDPHFDMMLSNKFRVKEKRLSHEKPEYFKDDEYSNAYDEIPTDDVIRETLHNVKSLSEKFESEVADFRKEQREDQFSSLTAISNQPLALQQRLRRPFWWLTAALIVLAFVIGKNI